ncbi:MAG: hypothetical protein R2722_07470 [Tessaracoccus sp.]
MLRARSFIAASVVVCSALSGCSVDSEEPDPPEYYPLIDFVGRKVSEIYPYDMTKQSMTIYGFPVAPEDIDSWEQEPPPGMPGGPLWTVVALCANAPKITPDTTVIEVGAVPNEEATADVIDRAKRGEFQDRITCTKDAPETPSYP